MINSLDGDGTAAGRARRTTYLAELLAPVERLTEPSPPTSEAHLVALSWAFVLVAVAALIVGGLIVRDVVRTPSSTGVRPNPAACADLDPCAAPTRSPGASGPG